MAGLTKDELKSALISHGVDMSFTNAKKDDLVALYDEYVAPYDVGNFSSDDEAAVVSPTKTKKTSRSSKKSASSSATNGEKKKRRSGKITEENSMIVGEIKVDELSDEDLIGYLKYYGIEVGPVVGKSIVVKSGRFQNNVLFLDSTRSIYQKKLAIVMRENEDQEEEVDSAANGHDNNGHHAEADNVNGSLNKSMTIGEFSADEEMEVNTEDEEQPSAVVRKSARKPTPKKTSSSSAKKEATSPMQSLRQRFGGIFHRFFSIFGGIFKMYDFQEPPLKTSPTHDSPRLHAEVFTRTKSRRPPSKQWSRLRTASSLTTSPTTRRPPNPRESWAATAEPPSSSKSCPEFSCFSSSWRSFTTSTR